MPKKRLPPKKPGARVVIRLTAEELQERERVRRGALRKDLLETLKENLLKNAGKQKGALERFFAAQELGYAKDLRAREALEKALLEDHKYNGSTIAWALGEIGDPKSIPVLENALKIADPKAILTIREIKRAIAKIKKKATPK